MRLTFPTLFEVAFPTSLLNCELDKFGKLYAELALDYTSSVKRRRTSSGKIVLMSSNSRTVYTTESGRICPNCGKPVDTCACKKKSSTPAAKGDGVVRVALEKKSRGGKTVSVITGLVMNEEALKTLATDLKRRCGTGGTVKEGTIEIQGDHRDTLVAALLEKGIKAKKAGG